LIDKEDKKVRSYRRLDFTNCTLQRIRCVNWTCDLCE